MTGMLVAVGCVDFYQTKKCTISNLTCHNCLQHLGQRRWIPEYDIKILERLANFNMNNHSVYSILTYVKNRAQLFKTNDVVS